MGEDRLENQRTILVVDDERTIRRAIRSELKGSFAVLVASGFQAAIDILETTPTIAAVVSDSHMGPDGTGIELLREVRNRWPDAVRILASGTIAEGLPNEVLCEGLAQRFIAKPWKRGQLLSAVQEVFEMSASNP